MMGSDSGPAPAIERMSDLRGPDMSADRVNGRGSATVIDLQGRRGDDVGSSVSVRAHHSGCWTVLEVEGEMDIQALPLVADLVHGDVPRVVFELRRVTFMDASGLGMMVDIQRTAQAGGGCVRLAAPSCSVRRVLALTGCDRVFPTFDSLLRALSTPIWTVHG